MKPRPWVLRESTWQQVRESGCDLAVLPWGATEAHNLHLPYGTDGYEAEAVAIEAARSAHEAGTRVVVLPGVPFGVNTGQLDIPLTINMNPSTQLAVLADVAASLEAQDIARLVIVNGHGGNDFKTLIRELQPRTAVLIATLDWWKVVPGTDWFDEPGDHGGELETSVMLHLHPDLVRPLLDAGPGAANAFTVQALREGWAWVPRDWRRATRDTGVGDPAAATAEKGARYFAAVTARVAAFFQEFASATRDNLYERPG